MIISSTGSHKILESVVFNHYIRTSIILFFIFTLQLLMV